ncbi:MAG: deoxyribose-phosphate aldolase [Bacilli bacterium]|nr:deoxyribose-phosphate aldolase [Bacilli bacterium]
MEFNKYFDHTLLKPEATEKDIEKLCEEARQYDFASVCVNPCYVSLAKRILSGSDVKVCTVIGFPLGANATSIKTAEATTAVLNGADEIDMVQNIGLVKEGKYDEITAEVGVVKDACEGRLLKVILETCLLTKEEIALSSKACKEAGADYVKTSTGFSKGGAKAEDVAIMREAVGPELGVKASGGIHTLEEAKAMIEAGATRLGCSASVAIMEEYRKAC